jgi:hypothetical protein
MLTLKDLQTEMHQKILRLRSIESLICKSDFLQIWESASVSEKKVVIEHINAGRREQVVIWQQRHRQKDLGEMSSASLKSIGRQLGIKNYSRLTKRELIQGIQREHGRTAEKND